ncbi:MAG: caspase family protein [Lentisphaeraceae bacterium]|nr:caspase family protein [Lentisphaeraceae bacterium]
MPASILNEPLASLNLKSKQAATVGVFTQISSSDFFFSTSVGKVSEKVCQILQKKENFNIVNVNKLRSSSACDLVLKIDAVYQINNEHTVDAPISGRLYKAVFNWDLLLVNPNDGAILKTWQISPYITQFRQPYWDETTQEYKNVVRQNAEHHLLKHIIDKCNAFRQWDQTIAKVQGRDLNSLVVKPVAVPKLIAAPEVAAVAKEFDHDSTALVVGISEYAFASRISSSVNDANLIAKMMSDTLNIAPENIVLLKDGGSGMQSPTKLIIEERLKMLCKETPKEGKLWVYLSGHGEIEDGDLKFLPQDGKAGNKISIKWLVAQMNSSEAAQKNLILDICHSDTDAKGLQVRQKTPVLNNKKTAMFMSCRDGELSYPLADGSSSVYTKYFIEAINKQKDSQIDISKLQKSIDRGLRSWRLKFGRQQTPQLILPQ